MNPELTSACWAGSICAIVTPSPGDNLSRIVRKRGSIDRRHRQVEGIYIPYPVTVIVRTIHNVYCSSWMAKGWHLSMFHVDSDL